MYRDQLITPCQGVNNAMLRIPACKKIRIVVIVIVIAVAGTLLYGSVFVRPFAAGGLRNDAASPACLVTEIRPGFTGNATVLAVTDNDLAPFPSIGEAFRESATSTAGWKGDKRIIGEFSGTDQTVPAFVSSTCRAPASCTPPVLFAWHGRYFEIACR